MSFSEIIIFIKEVYKGNSPAISNVQNMLTVRTLSVVRFFLHDSILIIMDVKTPHLNTKPRASS